VSCQFACLFDNTELDKSVQVVNIGSPGWDSLEETKQIKEKFVDYEPDIFVVYDGWNDAIATSKNKPEATGLQWKERWANICKLGELHEFETILILQPMVGRGNKALTTQETENFMKLHHQKILEIFPSYAEQIDELKIHCSAAEDFKNIFDDIHEPIYYDYGHTGYQGNKIIAENIFQLSVPIILNKIEDTDGNQETSNLIQITGQSSSDESDTFLEESYFALKEIISSYKTPRINSLIFNN